MLRLSRKDQKRFDARHHTIRIDDPKIAESLHRFLLEQRDLIDKLLSYDLSNARIQTVKPSILREIGMNISYLPKVADLLKCITPFDTSNKDEDDETHGRDADVYQYENISEVDYLLEIVRYGSEHGSSFKAVSVITPPKK